MFDENGGFNIADTTALRMLMQWGDDKYNSLVPVCGGASHTFSRLISSMLIGIDIVGIDTYNDSFSSSYSIVKHIDRALAQSITQWLREGKMPKHQTLGLKDGYTEVVMNPTHTICIWTPPGYEGNTVPVLTQEMKQAIHDEAVRKEEEHEKQ